MTIIFVTESLGSGGAERQIAGLAMLFKQHGHESIIVTWVDKNFYTSLLNSTGIPHIVIPQSHVNRVLSLSRLIRDRKAQAIISFLPMANETAALASLISPIKLIVSERSFTLSWGWRQQLTNLLYWRAKYIVANSINEAENIRRHCPKLKKRVIAIPNYVDVQRFSAIRTREEDNSVLSFVGVGRVIPTKNLHNLIQALAIVKSKGIIFKFKWYGATYDKKYLAELETLITTLDLDKEFVIKGECSNIKDVYHEADVLCMPSFLEGYPNVLVEAMASGLPVIVSNVCEHPRIVEDGINGFLFDPYNVEDMAAAICRMTMLSSQDRRIMGTVNSNKIAVNNSAEFVYNEFLTLLQS